MFLTATIAIIIIAAEFVAGCVIGLVVIAVMRRSRLWFGLVLRAGVFAGLAFLAMAGVAGWAGEHAEFINGQRQDVTSWGEHLWLRNRLAEYQPFLCVGSSIVAAVVTSLFSRRSNSHEDA